MNFALDPQQEKLLELVREVSRPFVARALEYDRAAAFPNKTSASSRRLACIPLRCRSATADMVYGKVTASSPIISCSRRWLASAARPRSSYRCTAMPLASLRDLEPKHSSTATCQMSSKGGSSLPPAGARHRCVPSGPRSSTVSCVGTGTTTYSTASRALRRSRLRPRSTSSGRSSKATVGWMKAWSSP